MTTRLKKKMPKSLSFIDSELIALLLNIRDRIA